MVSIVMYVVVASNWVLDEWTQFRLVGANNGLTKAEIQLYIDTRRKGVR